MNKDQYYPFYGILALVVLVLISEYLMFIGSLNSLLPSFLTHKTKLLLTQVGKPARIFFIVFYGLLSIATRGFRWITLKVAGRMVVMLLSTLMFIFFCYFLIGIEHWVFVDLLYPMSVLGIFISTPLVVLSCSKWRKPKDHFSIGNEKRKAANPYSFNFKAINGWINITNPFRGILVLGSNGSGKSESIAYPILKQAAFKNYSGIIYDFKFPKLTAHYYHHQKKARCSTKLYTVNFDHLDQTHRLNPIAPDLMQHSSYAREYAHAIVSNLGTRTMERNDFWSRSSTELLTGVFWYLAQEAPSYCSLPYAVAMILSEDDKGLLEVISRNPEVRGMVASMQSALRKGASNQSAGVIGTLQLALASLNTPEIFWVMSGDDFNLHLNDPKNPKVLALGSNPSLKETYAPIIACIITVALKLMNQSNQHHSLILLDEAPTVYIPKLETIPATARANKLSTIFIAQDQSQIIKGYGKVETDSLIGNLNYQLFGRLAHLETASYVSRLMGREDKVIHNTSRSKSKSHGSGGSETVGENFSYQERFLLKPQEVMSLRVGEFVGVSVESEHPHFRAQIIKGKDHSTATLPSHHNPSDLQSNFLKIHQEAETILSSKPAPKKSIAVN